MPPKANFHLGNGQRNHGAASKLTMQNVGKTLLIIVDIWIDTHIVLSILAIRTIKKPLLTLATHNLPQIVMSNNRTAAEFEKIPETK